MCTVGTTYRLKMVKILEKGNYNFGGVKPLSFYGMYSKNNRSGSENFVFWALV